MARLRTLKPSFFTHEVLGEMGPFQRLLFQGLWCYADREGRLKDRPRFLKTVILPYDDVDVDAMLEQLAGKGFIRRYEVAGERFIDIPAFHRHQKPHPREPGSELPPFEARTQSETTPAKVEPETPVNTGTLPGNAEAMPRQCLGNARPGGLGDFGLGDFGLGEHRPSPESQNATPAPTPGPSSIMDRRARPREETPIQAMEVYAHYRDTFGRRHPEPSAEERDAICARLLEDFSPSELCRAIDGLANSDWHKRRGWIALRYALGDRDTVERCIQWADNPPDEATGPPRYDANQGIMRGAS